MGEQFEETIPLLKGQESLANMDCFILLIYRPIYWYIRSIIVSNKEVPKEIKICIFVYHNIHTLKILRQLEGIKYLNFEKSSSMLFLKWINYAKQSLNSMLD